MRKFKPTRRKDQIRNIQPLSPGKKIQKIIRKKYNETFSEEFVQTIDKHFKRYKEDQQYRKHLKLIDSHPKIVFKTF